MDGPCVLPWLPATHDVATAETDDPALAVLTSAPESCSRECVALGRVGASQLRPQMCDAGRAIQYAAVVLVCACEGGSLPSLRVAAHAIGDASGGEASVVRVSDGPIWLWFARALVRAARACIVRRDAAMIDEVVDLLRPLMGQTAYPRIEFWRDAGFADFFTALWCSDSPLCSAVAAQRFVADVASAGFAPPGFAGVVRQMVVHAEGVANTCDPRSFAAFWSTMWAMMLDRDSMRTPHALVCAQPGRALARGEWRAASCWIAAWATVPPGDNILWISYDELWPLCIAALTSSPLGAECRLLRRLVRAPDIDLQGGCGGARYKRVVTLWEAACAAHRLGAQATTSDLAPWLRLCAELHPGTTSGWVEKRVRRALCALGARA